MVEDRRHRTEMRTIMITTNSEEEEDQLIRGATRGVTVSVSAFLACRQYYCAGSSLAWGLNLRAVACGSF